ncbi:hypothetical protein HYC85_019016 [Camellia sinensis]|uniref:Uncharacterized protein n=1 Tax=Camellia sinensis TaxID=4442 RepID=A0A7J7GW00_CAMSI|nr:hypothetical protein HYC85_019016 [Camellia sinensis]
MYRREAGKRRKPSIAADGLPVFALVCWIETVFGFQQSRDREREREGIPDLGLNRVE